MTLITFTSPTDDLVQTAVSWEIARTLSNMGRRVVYLPLVPNVQIDRLNTKGVEICKTPLEVRQSFFRTNWAMVPGLELTWPGTARVMQMVRAGRRAGAVVIIAGGRQEQSFTEICLASDLTVQCVKPIGTDIESAKAQRQKMDDRARKFQLDTGHLVALFAQVETSKPALSIARPRANGEWLGGDLNDSQGLIEGVAATLQTARETGPERLYTDTLYAVTAEIVARAGGNGAHIRAMAGHSWFLHIGLLRGEFNELPPKRREYVAVAS